MAHFQVLVGKKRTVNPEPSPAKISSRNEGKTKTDLDEVKLREFGASRPILKEQLQKSL